MKANLLAVGTATGSPEGKERTTEAESGNARPRITLLAVTAGFIAALVGAPEALALDPCRSSNPPPGCADPEEPPEEPPSAPAATLRVLGLGGGTVTVSSGGSPVVRAWKAAETLTFIAGATSAHTKYTQLVVESTLRCDRGRDTVTHVRTATVQWRAVPIEPSFTREAGVCPEGFKVDETMVATAEAKSGATVRSTPSITLLLRSAGATATVQVAESSNGTSSGLFVAPGDSVEVIADGQIWSGWFLGPWDDANGGADSCGDLIDERDVIDWEGEARWVERYDTGNCRPGLGYPIPEGAASDQLIAGVNHRWVPVGTFRQFVWDGPEGVFTLRNNDNTPGNGDGAWRVKVRITPAP